LALSAKVQYGIVSLIELAAIHSRGGVLQVAEIAQRQNIPDRYLEQMLTSLRRARILRSIRGPKGGYQLARPPADVSVLDVVAALEGEAPARSTTDRSSAEFEVLTSLEERLDNARRDILVGTSLQDLLDQRDQLAQAQVMFFI
jgi:Rrf2 family protein